MLTTKHIVTALAVIVAGFVSAGLAEEPRMVPFLLKEGDRVGCGFNRFEEATDLKVQLTAKEDDEEVEKTVCFDPLGLHLWVPSPPNSNLKAAKTHKWAAYGITPNFKFFGGDGPTLSHAVRIKGWLTESEDDSGSGGSGSLGASGSPDIRVRVDDIDIDGWCGLKNVYSNIPWMPTGVPEEAVYLTKPSYDEAELNAHDAIELTVEGDIEPGVHLIVNQLSEGFFNICPELEIRANCMQPATISIELDEVGTDFMDLWFFDDDEKWSKKPSGEVAVRIERGKLRKSKTLRVRIVVPYSDAAALVAAGGAVATVTAEYVPDTNPTKKAVDKVRIYTTDGQDDLYPTFETIRPTTTDKDHYVYVIDNLDEFFPRVEVVDIYLCEEEDIIDRGITSTRWSDTVTPDSGETPIKATLYSDETELAPKDLSVTCDVETWVQFADDTLPLHSSGTAEAVMKLVQECVIERAPEAYESCIVHEPCGRWYCTGEPARKAELTLTEDVTVTYHNTEKTTVSGSVEGGMSKTHEFGKSATLSISAIDIGICSSQGQTVSASERREIAEAWGVDRGVEQTWGRTLKTLSGTVRPGYYAQFYYVVQSLEYRGLANIWWDRNEDGVADEARVDRCDLLADRAQQPVTWDVVAEGKPPKP